MNSKISDHTRAGDIIYYIYPIPNPTNRTHAFDRTVRSRLASNLFGHRG